jgi:tRNA splicing ligase
MKIISFYTFDMDTDMSHDLTIFFEMTDTEYNRMMEIPFSDVREMYNHCKNVSEGEWNTVLFEDDDELALDFAYEHTTQSTFTFN